MKTNALPIVLMLVAATARAAETKLALCALKPGLSAAERAKALSALARSGLETGEIRAEIRGRVFDAWELRSASGLDPEASKDFVIEEDRAVVLIQAQPATVDEVALPSVSALVEGFPKLRAQAFARGPLIPWGVRKVGAPAAWPVTEGRGVKVAVLDSGLDSRNPGLDGRVLAGYNAMIKSEDEGAYQDDVGHGTHVAGTIGATRGSGSPVVGVAPQVSFYAVKVLDAAGEGSLLALVRGLVWSVVHGAQVINMSLGLPKDRDGKPQDSAILHQVIEFASGMGVVVVAAAGNDGGETTPPASYPETISVSALTADGKLAKFSSRGKVDFIAPGQDIVSLAPGRQTVSWSGTSMATPHVTGLAALAISQGARGVDGPDGVREALRKAASQVPGLTPQEQGAGLVDAGKLVAE